MLLHGAVVRRWRAARAGVLSHGPCSPAHRGSSPQIEGAARPCRLELAPVVTINAQQSSVLLTAASPAQDCDEPDAAALEELARLRSAAVAHRCAAHASVLAEAGRLNKGIASLDIGQTAGHVTEAWLLTSMDEWQSFAADGSPHVAPIPPSLQPIPARPILLDAAQDYVAYKSLAHRAEQRPETKSTFSRLFAGWGR